MTGRIPRLSHQAALRLTADGGPYLSCDECFDQIDGYIDALLGDTGRISAPLRAHLLGCSACGEEAWSLLTLAAADQGVRLEHARARFERDLGGRP